MRYTRFSRSWVDLCGIIQGMEYYLYWGCSLFVFRWHWGLVHAAGRKQKRNTTYWAERMSVLRTEHAGSAGSKHDTAQQAHSTHNARWETWNTHVCPCAQYQVKYSGVARKTHTSTEHERVRDKLQNQDLEASLFQRYLHGKCFVQKSHITCTPEPHDHTYGQNKYIKEQPFRFYCKTVVRLVRARCNLKLLLRSCVGKSRQTYRKSVALVQKIERFPGRSTTETWEQLTFEVMIEQGLYMASDFHFHYTLKFQAF